MGIELKSSLSAEFISPYIKAQKAVVSAGLLYWTPAEQKQEAPWAQREGTTCLIHAECSLLPHENENCPTTVWPQEKWILLAIQGRDRTTNGLRGDMSSRILERTMLYWKLFLTFRQKTMMSQIHGSPETGKNVITS